ncbi:MAG: HAMP domain-containing sensor histidine kinase [bacterium]|nr:HAMP domain-containing sensor histidine kinase [bacterium]
MKQSMHKKLSLTIMSVVLLVILLVGVLTIWSVRKEFRTYIERQQVKKTEALIDTIEHSYQPDNEGWDEDELHAIAMSALYEGFIVTVYDREGNVIWDAESHDMSLCNQIRGDIVHRMQKDNGENRGSFETNQYELDDGTVMIGYVNISVYGPYFYNQNDFTFLDALTKIIIIVGGAALILSIGIAYMLARNISKPILNAVEVTNQIANGRYQVTEFEHTNIIELEKLSFSIRKLSDSIAKQEQIRKQLTSDVAHELRTPLTAVSTHLEAMIEGIWEPSTEHIESCYEEVKRIISIVKDLEQLERIENKSYNLMYTSFSLKELVQRLLRNFAIYIQEKELTVTLTGEEANIVADEERIGQVVINLLSNAIKYTDKKGKIEIAITEREDNVQLMISDSGIGISKEELPYIFERFYRADKSRNRKTGGAGIGLTIVKSIVEAHNGVIKVESELLKGTTIEVVLPKKQEDLVK